MSLRIKKDTSLNVCRYEYIFLNLNIRVQFQGKFFTHSNFAKTKLGDWDMGREGAGKIIENIKNEKLLGQIKLIELKVYS